MRSRACLTTMCLGLSAACDPADYCPPSGEEFVPDLAPEAVFDLQEDIDAMAGQPCSGGRVFGDLRPRAWSIVVCGAWCAPEYVDNLYCVERAELEAWTEGQGEYHGELSCERDDNDVQLCRYPCVPWGTEPDGGTAGPLG